MILKEMFTLYKKFLNFFSKFMRCKSNVNALNFYVVKCACIKKRGTRVNWNLFSYSEINFTKNKLYILKILVYFFNKPLNCYTNS